MHITVETGSALNAFTAAASPSMMIHVESHGVLANSPRYLRVSRFDLLSEQMVIEDLPLSVSGGAIVPVSYKPSMLYGVHRLDFALADGRHTNLPDPTSVRRFIAYAPAKWAKDLPEDWPLGTHISSDHPPMPGFKWYRHFSLWSANNPARGKYDWRELDRVFQTVKSIGGKLLIADDTTPVWAVAPERVAGVPWVSNATAYPPDDMDNLRAYLRELVKRYDDGSGTLAGLEVWNEPNTRERWMGTPQQMTQIAAIVREAASRSSTPIIVAGISVSAGDHTDYVNKAVQSGELKYLDVVSGHWYEEMFSFESGTPINNLPKHVALLRDPVRRAGFDLPIWNTECGIESAERENGRLVPQNELNRRTEAEAGFDPKQPWMVGTQWRSASERRAAALFVSGIVMLMGHGVDKTFTYHHFGWHRDGTLSLQWVSVAVLGSVMARIDYHHVTPVQAEPHNPPSVLVKAMAYRLGWPEGRSVIVAWSYLSDLSVGRSKLWQQWLTPVPVRITTQARSVTVVDLYGRNKCSVQAQDGHVSVDVGEEPVYVWEE